MIFKSKEALKRKKEVHYVYSLSDPITNEIKYIGLSHNPRRRYIQHLCTDNGKNKDIWIKRLKEKGTKPILKIISKHKGWAEANKRELYLINNTKGLLNIRKNG